MAERVVTGTGAGVLYYLHGDHLGSTSLVTCGTAGQCGALGAVVARQRYHPFGTVRDASGTMPTDYAFTGQMADATGLLYFRARFFDPALGRESRHQRVNSGAVRPPGMCSAPPKSS